MCQKDENGNYVFGDLDRSGNVWKINLIHSKSEQDDLTTETVDVVKAWK